MKHYEIDIFADYSQFLIGDEASDEDFARLWTDSSFRERFATGKDVISVGTTEPDDIRILLEIYENQPEPCDLEKYSQVVECDLSLPSGNLIVMSVTDYLPGVNRIPLAPGLYRVRIHYSNRERSFPELFLVSIWRKEKKETVSFLKREFLRAASD